jgi:hypothetical protein
MGANRRDGIRSAPSDKRRGIVISRYLHVTRPGKEKEALECAAKAIELQFDYYGPFLMSLDPFQSDAGCRDKAPRSDGIATSSVRAARARSHAITNSFRGASRRYYRPDARRSVSEGVPPN